MNGIYEASKELWEVVARRHDDEQGITHDDTERIVIFIAIVRYSFNLFTLHFRGFINFAISPSERRHVPCFDDATTTSI